MIPKTIKVKIEFDNGKTIKGKISYGAYEDIQKLHGHSLLDDVVESLLKDAEIAEEEHLE